MNLSKDRILLRTRNIESIIKLISFSLLSTFLWPPLRFLLNLLSQLHFDKEFELSIEGLTLVCGRHEVLSDLVNLCLHFEVLLLDIQLIPLVQLVEHLAAFERSFGDGLVDFGDLPLENNTNRLQFPQKLLQLPLSLLFLQNIGLHRFHILRSSRI